MNQQDSFQANDLAQTSRSDINQSRDVSDVNLGLQKNSEYSARETAISYNDARENLLSPIEGSYKDDSEEEAPEVTKTVNLCKYFSYCDTKDKMILAGAISSSVMAGAILPSISLIMGNVATAFTGDDTDPDSRLISQMNYIVTYVILISMGEFVFSYLFYALFQHLAENITNDLRQRYLASLMRQEVAYFERNNVEEMPAQMNELFDVVKQSIGDKLGTFLFSATACVAGIIYSMFFGAGYGGICALYLPFILAVIGIFGMQVKKTAQGRIDVAKALGGIAEESLTAIKVVSSFGREDREIQKFDKWSQNATAVSKTATRTMSFMVGLMKFVMFSFYTYAMFIGSRQMLNHGYSQSQVLSVLIALITGFVQLVSALPNVQAFVQLVVLGPLIFDVIEREPRVCNSKVAVKGEAISLQHHIKFVNVTFKYPTASKEFKPVLQNVNFEMQAGESTAIVGPSGSGKSTIVQLIERFYDVRSEGKICFDNKNIRDIDLKVLRETIGYVSQEPIMVMGTIRDNLLYGNKDATEADMREALKKASANFVFEQENQLDTFVGVAGIVNMSGGQKQRIAIARALIRKPKILVLDEATSALDPKSELEVQGAIEQIQKTDSGLTILIIAHRLTTIQSANNLLYFKSRSELVSATKGSRQYDDIIERLKNMQYAAGVDDEEAPEASSSSEYGSEDELPLLENHPIEEIDEGECSETDEEGPSNKDISGNNSKKVQHKNDKTKQVSINIQEKSSDENDLLEDDDNEKQDLDASISSENHNRRTVSHGDSNSILKPKSSFELSPKNASPRNSNMVKKTKPYRSDTGMGLKSHSLLKNSNASVRSKKSKGRTSSGQLSGKTGQKRITGAMSIASSVNSDEPNFEQQRLKGEEYYREITASEMMTYYDPRYLAWIGFAASFACAFGMPFFGYILSMYIITIGGTYDFNNEADRDTFASECDRWTFFFFLFTIMIGGLTFIQKLCFGLGGDNLSYTLRIKLFSAILHKHVGWFDSKDHAPGILTNILIEDITKVNGLTTESIGILLEAFLGLGISCLMCFIFCWQVALVVSCISPFMVLGGVGMTKVNSGSKEEETAYKAANALLSDLVLNYKTIITFGEKNVNLLLFRYSELLIIPHKAGVKRAHIQGLFFGYSQAIRFVFVGIVFYVAAVFLQSDPLLDSNQVYTGCYIVFVGAIGAGVALSFMPSIAGAKNSAKKVFGIIEEKSDIDPRQKGHSNITHGRIQFDQVSFRYPSRKRYVLRHFNLTIEPNTSVAVVGHSGSGKSTIAGLLLRFYDSRRGKIVIDGRDLRDYSVSELRRQISIVQQEPLLFNESIKENILFGEPGATDQRIREVAIQANALGFIMQSEEDINNSDVQEKMRNSFNEIRRQVLNEARHPNLWNIVTAEIQNSKSLDYKHLWLICEVLPFLNAKGVEELEKNYQYFKKLVKDKAYKTDVTWQEVFKCVGFKDEYARIEQFISTKIQNEEIQKELKIALQTNECQFDVKTIETFLQEHAKQKDEFKFNTYLRKEKSQVPQRYEEYLKEHVNQEKLRLAEATLHPGFQKLCGLKGSKLSGGQKQRVAIARALIKNPKILILDEATSALDEQSQEIVQAALDKAMDGRTSIVIAHRLSTIMKCDRIVVVQKGQIVEDGTFDQLSEIPNGHFARLKAGIA